MAKQQTTHRVPGALPAARAPREKPTAKTPPPAATDDADATGRDKPLRQNLPAPMCPYHKETQTKANRSEPFFTRYYCPEKGCTFSQKVPREDLARRMRRDRDEGDYSAR